LLNIVHVISIRPLLYDTNVVTTCQDGVLYLAG